MAARITERIGLATVATLTMLVGAADQSAAAACRSLGETDSLIEELAVRVRVVGRASQRAAATQRSDQARVQMALKSINRLAQAAAPPDCADTAELYLATGAFLDAGGEGSINLDLTGNDGSMPFTFASGAAMADIISAINGFIENTGVSAIQNLVNADRIELRSVSAGADQFVSAAQTGGPSPIIFAEPVGGSGAFALEDYGVAAIPGDLNCDQAVDTLDLMQMLAAWGPCPKPPAGCPEDLDGDGAVNVPDLLTLLAHWGSGI